eukprot:1284549-Amphidinium_carterae.1
MSCSGPYISIFRPLTGETFWEGAGVDSVFVLCLAPQERVPKTRHSNEKGINLHTDRMSCNGRRLKKPHERPVHR